MVEAEMISKEQVVAELAAKLSPSTTLRFDEPLAKKTTLRVGGPADFFCGTLIGNRPCPSFGILR